MSSKLRILLLTLALATAAAAGASPNKVGTTAGRTYGEWSARWWQWLYSIPASENPQLQQGPVDCLRNQSGSVYFLAGAQSGTTAVRSCTVPASKALFFPVANILFVNEPPEQLTVAEKRDLLEKFVSDTHPGFVADLGFPGTRFCEMTATLDGQPILYREPIARVQSPPFYLATGPDPVGLTPNVVDPQAVSDGFWAMIPPLSPGAHTLRFTARICQFDNFDDHPLFGPIDVTYHLQVTSRSAEP